MPVSGPQKLGERSRFVITLPGHTASTFRKLKSFNLNIILVVRESCAGHRSHHVSLHGNCHRGAQPYSYTYPICNV